eukprot:207968_1
MFGSVDFSANSLHSGRGRPRRLSNQNQFARGGHGQPGQHQMQPVQQVYNTPPRFQDGQQYGFQTPHTPSSFGSQSPYASSPYSSGPSTPHVAIPPQPPRAPALRAPPPCASPRPPNASNSNRVVDKCAKVEYVKSFAIDRVGSNANDNYSTPPVPNGRPVNELPLPMKYDRNGQPDLWGCFNCGEKHMIRDCPHKNNRQVITMNRTWKNDYGQKRKRMSQNRYFTEPETSKAREIELNENERRIAEAPSLQIFTELGNMPEKKENLEESASSSQFASNQHSFVRHSNGASPSSWPPPSRGRGRGRGRGGRGRAFNEQQRAPRFNQSHPLPRDSPQHSPRDSPHYDHHQRGPPRNESRSQSYTPSPHSNRVAREHTRPYPTHSHRTPDGVGRDSHQPKPPNRYANVNPAQSGGYSTYHHSGQQQGSNGAQHSQYSMQSVSPQHYQGQFPPQQFRNTQQHFQQPHFQQPLPPRRRSERGRY